MNMKIRTIHPYLAAAILFLILGVWGFFYFFGPLDSVPRMHASAISPDGSLKVEVYRKRVSLLPNSQIDMIAKVKDGKGNLLYEKVVLQEGMWSETENLYLNIVFAGDEIQLRPGWGDDDFYSIRRSDLKVVQ